MVDPLTLWVWGVIALNLAVAVVAMCLIRFGSGFWFKVSTSDELAERDNLAFGLSLAGGISGVALILAGATAGEAELTYLDELKMVVTYAALGLVLLKMGALINDWVILPGFSVREQVRSQNVSAGVVQASNLLALGILINGAMNWHDGGLGQGLLAVAVVFLLSQIVVLAATRMRFAIFARRNEGRSWQDAIRQGNVALGIRYAGHLIGTALASSSAGGLVTFGSGISITAWGSYLLWLVWALVLAAALLLLSMLAQRVILSKVDLVEEVDQQQNAGVAFVEATVFVSIGILFRVIIG